MFSNPTRITDNCTVIFIKDIQKIKRKKKKIDSAEKDKEVKLYKLSEIKKLITSGKIQCTTSIAAILLAKERGFINF